MNLGGVMVFEPPAGEVAPTVEAVREQLAARLGEIPRYLQRLSSARTGGLAWPHWVPDERFDIRHHVGHAKLPTPGDSEQLSDWTAEFFSRPLDRTRPLWEIVLVEGLESGHWALGWKTHHCLVDGVVAVELLSRAAGSRADGEDGANAAEERVARTVMAITHPRGRCSGRRRHRARGQRRGSRCRPSQGGVGPLTPGRRADRARRAARHAPHFTERADRPDAPVRRRASPAGGAESDRSPPRRLDHRCGAGGGDRRPASVAALARGGASETRAARAGAGHPPRLHRID